MIGKTLRALTFAVACACAAVAFAAPSDVSTRVKALNDLLAEQWQYQLKESPEFATILGDYRYNDRFSDITIAHALQQKKDAQAFLARFEAIDTTGVEEIAKRARGTPRIANRLLKRVRDYAQVRADGEITATVADRALHMMEVDHLGLDNIDKKVLQTIIEKFDGGPVGIDAYTPRAVFPEVEMQHALPSNLRPVSVNEQDNRESYRHRLAEKG